MSIFVYLSALFIVYEILKVVMMKTYWTFASKEKKSKLIVVMDIFYLAFLIALFITKYWYVGLGVLAVSIVTAIGLSKYIVERSALNMGIRKILWSDCVVSVIILMVIILKEFQLW